MCFEREIGIIRFSMFDICKKPSELISEGFLDLILGNYFCCLKYSKAPSKTVSLPEITSATFGLIFMSG